MVESEQVNTGTGTGYALVTGAGQGIGLAFSKALAKRGRNLILVALPGENLRQTAESLESCYGIKTIIIEADLTQSGVCQQIMVEIQKGNLVVDVLINNAGIGSNGLFTDFSCAFYERQIMLNCQVPVILCRLIIPQMKTLDKAHILNVASLGAFFPMPHKEVYVATKAFIVSFTRSLQRSLKGSAITATVICPGGVDSNPRLRGIHKHLKGIGKMAIMQPDEVAEEALDALFSGDTMRITGKINKILFWLNAILPTFIRSYLIQREMNRQELIKCHAVEKPHTR